MPRVEVLEQLRQPGVDAVRSADVESSLDELWYGLAPVAAIDDVQPRALITGVASGGAASGGRAAQRHEDQIVLIHQADDVVPQSSRLLSDELEGVGSATAAGQKQKELVV